MDKQEPRQEPRYPGNSKTSYNNVDQKRQAPVAERKPIEKIVKGKVSTRKKGLCEKFAETFLASDLKTVVRQIMFDVLVPAAKDTIADMINGATNLMLFDGNGKRGGRYVRDRDRSYVRTVDYGSYYNDRRPPDNGPGPGNNQIPSSRKPFDNLIFTSRADGEDVLTSMFEQLEAYGVVSVKDLYDFAGLETDYTKIKYGWFNLENSSVDRVREGYMLKLPRPVVID